MDWRRVALLLAGFLAIGSARADGECRPLKQVVSESLQAGYIRFLYANEIASEDSLPDVSNGIATRSAGAPRIRKALESMVELSLDAGSFAEQAVAGGVIPSPRPGNSCMRA